MQWKLKAQWVLFAVTQERDDEGLILVVALETREEGR